MGLERTSEISTSANFRFLILFRLRFIRRFYSLCVPTFFLRVFMNTPPHAPRYMSRSLVRKTNLYVLYKL